MEEHSMFEKVYQTVRSLHNEGRHARIVELITHTEGFDTDYRLTCYLARAHNNMNNYDEAIVLLESVAEQGKEDALWYYRMGYSLFYKHQDRENLEKALALVQKSWEIGGEVALDLLATIKKHLGYDLTAEEADMYNEVLRNIRSREKEESIFDDNEWKNKKKGRV